MHKRHSDLPTVLSKILALLVARGSSQQPLQAPGSSEQPLQDMQRDSLMTETLIDVLERVPVLPLIALCFAVHMPPQRRWRFRGWLCLGPRDNQQDRAQPHRRRCVSWHAHRWPD